MLMMAATSTQPTSEPERPSGSMRGDAEAEDKSAECTLSVKKLKKGRSRGKMLLKSGLGKLKKMVTQRMGEHVIAEWGLYSACLEVLCSRHDGHT